MGAGASNSTGQKSVKKNQQNHIENNQKNNNIANTQNNNNTKSTNNDAIGNNPNNTNTNSTSPLVPIHISISSTHHTPSSRVRSSLGNNNHHNHNHNHNNSKSPSNPSASNSPSKSSSINLSIYSELRGHFLSYFLSSSELEELSTLFEIVKFPPNTAIYSQNQLCTNLYLIRAGKVNFHVDPVKINQIHIVTTPVITSNYGYNRMKSKMNNSHNNTNPNTNSNSIRGKIIENIHNKHTIHNNNNNKSIENPVVSPSKHHHSNHNEAPAPLHLSPLSPLNTKYNRSLKDNHNNHNHNTEGPHNNHNHNHNHHDNVNHIADVDELLAFPPRTLSNLTLQNNNSNNINNNHNNHNNNSSQPSTPTHNTNIGDRIVSKSPGQLFGYESLIFYDWKHLLNNNYNNNNNNTNININSSLDLIDTSELIYSCTAIASSDCHCFSIDIKLFIQFLSKYSHLIYNLIDLLGLKLYNKFKQHSSGLYSKLTIQQSQLLIALFQQRELDINMILNGNSNEINHENQPMNDLFYLYSGNIIAQHCKTILDEIQNNNNNNNHNYNNNVIETRIEADSLFNEGNFYFNLSLNSNNIWNYRATSHCLIFELNKRSLQFFFQFNPIYTNSDGLFNGLALYCRSLTSEINFLNSFYSNSLIETYFLHYLQQNDEMELFEFFQLIYLFRINFTEIMNNNQNNQQINTGTSISGDNIDDLYEQAENIYFTYINPESNTDNSNNHNNNNININHYIEIDPDIKTEIINNLQNQSNVNALLYLNVELLVVQRLNNLFREFQLNHEFNGLITKLSGLNHRNTLLTAQGQNSSNSGSLHTSTPKHKPNTSQSNRSNQ